VFDIERGFHGSTKLDGLRAAAIFRWPGERRGEGVQIIDRRATPEQRRALLRILQGEDTEPGATVFQVFASLAWLAVLAGAGTGMDLFAMSGWMLPSGEPASESWTGLRPTGSSRSSCGQ
jgi:hypothetical protein